jgi:hypothetical protein
MLLDSRLRGNDKKLINQIFFNIGLDSDLSALLSGIILNTDIKSIMKHGVNNSINSGKLEKIPPRKARPPFDKGGCASEQAPLCKRGVGEEWHLLKHRFRDNPGV